MSSWRDEYIHALHERDKREKASYQCLDSQLIDAFTKLLERTAALEAEKAANTPSEAAPRDSAQATTPNDGTAQLRADLAEAIRSNGRLQARVKVAETELAKTKALNKSDAKQIKDLTTERDLLTRRVRDKDEEIRGKAKVFHDTQDELISRDLELNMCEKQKKKLEAENKELIDRWMAHKGQQAEEMNRTLHTSPRGK